MQVTNIVRRSPFDGTSVLVNGRLNSTFQEKTFWVTFDFRSSRRVRRAINHQYRPTASPTSGIPQFTPENIYAMCLRAISPGGPKRTCKTLKRLCLDKKLMTKLLNPPDDNESMNLVFTKCINKNTTELAISSSNYPNRGSRSSISPSLLLSISPAYSLAQENIPRALTHLRLVRQKLDGRLFEKIIMLPNTLKVLELTGTDVTHITEEDHWFKNMSLHFLQLEELTMKYCTWVTTHALLAISKCPELISLDLEGCRNVGDSIPYCSLASLNGFLKLKILNLNNTDIRNSDFQSFCKISTLEEIYFGKYYAVDNPVSKCVWDTFIAFSVHADCKNLRVMDMSGCFLSHNDKDRRHESIISLLCLDTKLERVYAHVMEPLPPHFLQVIKRHRPFLEVNQAPFM